MESIKEFIEKNARPIVAVLVVIAAVTTISLAGNNGDEVATNDNEQQTTAESTEKEAENTDTSAPAQPKDGEAIGSEPDAGPVDVKEDKEQYRAEVRSGDNQTVIARQMVNEFLEDESKSLTAEQRLYIETVVVDSLPRNDVIFVGDVITVDKSVVSSAVKSAEALSEAELSRWSVYL